MLQMNPPQSPHKNAPVWPLEQPELWAAAAADVLTSVPHFSQLGWKAGLDLSLLFHDLEADCCLGSMGECLESASPDLGGINCPCCHRAGNLGSPGRATRSSQYPVLPRPLLPVFLLLAIGNLPHWGPCGGFLAQELAEFLLYKGPCYWAMPPSICAYNVLPVGQVGDFSVLESKDTRVASFFSSLLWFCGTGISFLPPSQNCEHKFQQCKKAGSFFPLSFFPQTV